MLYGNNPDDRRYMEMREVRQQYIAHLRQIERLQYKLDNNKIEVYEKKEDIKEELDKSKERRDILESTFDRRFGVQGYEGLKEEIRRIDFEKYGIPDGKKEQQGSQGSQGGPEVPVPKKEDREAVERNMKEAADTKNYELFQAKEQEALRRSQEASSQIGYSRQLLHEEKQRGGKDHGNKNHGDALHQEIKKSIFRGARRRARAYVQRAA